MPHRIVLCFPEGKHKAVTMSYDDGKVGDRRLVELFNRHGFKGTFHLNSGLLGSGEGDNERIAREEMVELYRGHEISAHTLTHPTIARCPKEHIIHEVVEDRKNLEEIAGYTVRGISYPNGSYNSTVKAMLPHLGIEYARVVEPSHGYGIPDDWHEWKPTCHHNQGLLKHAEDFVALNKTQYLYLLYVWGHSYDFDRDDNWQVIEQFCEYVGDRDDIWYATNIEIVDYMKAYEQLKFSAAQDFVYNPTAMSIWLAVNNRTVEVKSGSQVRLSS